MAVGEDKNKEIDLMEQVRNIKCDDKTYFELCKKQALEYIEKAKLYLGKYINEGEIEINITTVNEVQQKLFTCFNSQIEINTDIEDRNRECLLYMEDCKLHFIAARRNDSFFSYGCVKKKATIKPDNLPYIFSNDSFDKTTDLSSIIFNDNFYTTLCNFLHVVEVFFNNQIPEVTAKLNNILKKYYSISCNLGDLDDEYNVRVIPKNNTEIIKAVENESSLSEVMKYYKQNDIKKALGELRKITEFSKNKEFENFVNSQEKDLKEMCKKVYDFITKCENHNGGKENATQTEQRIWLDLGLSIYRLYLMNYTNPNSLDDSEDKTTSNDDNEVKKDDK